MIASDGQLVAMNLAASDAHHTHALEIGRHVQSLAVCFQQAPRLLVLKTPWWRLSTNNTA